MPQRPRQGVNRMDRTGIVVDKDQVRSKGVCPGGRRWRAGILVERFGETEKHQGKAGVHWRPVSRDEIEEPVRLKVFRKIVA